MTEPLDASGGEPAAPAQHWSVEHVSSYATMHPWEDWAETFAHYLHIRDSLQTAAAYGMSINGPTGPDLESLSDPDSLSATATLDHDDDKLFQPILDEWLPLTYALNAINRSMGNEDLYPFVLTPVVVSKLAFVHRLVQSVQNGA